MVHMSPEPSSDLIGRRKTAAQAHTSEHDLHDSRNDFLW
jgi:hypothetical protein